MNNEDNFFDQFWQASSLSQFNAQQFAQQLASYDSDNKELGLAYPQKAHSLPLPRSTVNKLATKRVSVRVFSGKRLSSKQLGLIMSSFYAHRGLEHRGYPSAGATYTTEIFIVPFNIADTVQHILYYDAEQHGIVDTNIDAPSWAEAKPTLNVEVEGEPGALLLFVGMSGRATAKYGERGGRFMLLEAGAAIQQLALQIADDSKLKGLALGGVLDETWRETLRLKTTDAKLLLGYLVGR